MNRSRDCPGEPRNITRALLLAALLIFEIAIPTDAAPLATEDYTVAASDPGIKLFVRNKRLADATEYSAARTVLFIHGSTYPAEASPAEASFDLALDGHSWMDLIAERGFDVYLLDLRGYGRSTRPREMDEAPASNEPIVTTQVALRDVSAVVADILQRRQIRKLSLIGWSWGTTIAASYAIQNFDKVDRLVLYGPQWLGEGNVSSRLGAYRTVTRTQAREQWLAGVPREQQRDLIPSDWFERWADAILTSDPVGAAQDPPVLRAPNGTVSDSQRYWRAGVPFYDPAQIVAPVLLIHGEWDRDTPAAMSQALFAKLKSAPWRRYVVIGEATHMVMMEKNRQQLFEEVQLFLEREEGPRLSGTLQVASAIASHAEKPQSANGEEWAPSDAGNRGRERANDAERQPQPAGGQVAAGSEGGKMASDEPAKDAETPQPAGGERAASSEAEKTASRSLANDGETGQSTGGERESAMLGSSHGPPTAAAVSAQVTALMARAEEFLGLGDIAAARLLYERAAESGSERAMTALGKTYDPEFLDRMNAVGIRPDPAAAAHWYRKAIGYDGTQAAFCNERLKALGQQ